MTHWTMCFVALSLATTSAALAQQPATPPPRTRDLGVPFDGTPGALNAITDVPGVEIGQVTILSGSGPLVVGRGPVRTGVTAILPRGRETITLPVFGGGFVLNGAGEMTGMAWLEESGALDGPVLLTNTHSVGTAHQAAIAWRVRQGDPDGAGYWWSTPVVAETWDGDLNDINGFHVRAEHVDKALDTAEPGPVAEGNVGGGTGMICHEFKCGIGTSSRRVAMDGREHIVGVLVQANYGRRESLRIAGVPVGQHLLGDRVNRDGKSADGDTGSIIVVIATDAPLLPHQLKRIARRGALGLARMGSFAGNGSGDIFIAFSTANAAALHGSPLALAELIDNGRLDPLFEATVQATEEAIVNAIVAARDMAGTEGHSASALPHADLVALLEHYGRLVK